MQIHDSTRKYIYNIIKYSRETSNLYSVDCAELLIYTN